MESDDARGALEAADEAWARFDVEGVVTHLSAAVRMLTAAGDNRAASTASIRLGDALANLMGNLTAGRAWFARAARLVADEPPCLEQGWAAVAVMGCDVEDPDELLAAADVALDRARRFGDLDLETKALADAGLAHVQSGRVDEGMRLLDEAMALACGPAGKGPAAAKSVCSFFTACYHAGDFERAGSWAELLRRHGLLGSAPGGPVFLSSHCDAVQAALLVELGQWGEAEALLIRSKADFEAAMGPPSWHPDIALADLRIRQGRLVDAEVLLLGKDQVIEALLPAARLHLARGDVELARATARRGLRPLGRDRLRSAELLTVLVGAELMAGDVAAAGRAATDLADRLAGVDVPALRGRAAIVQARVRVAGGDVAGGVDGLEATADHLDAGDQLPWLRATLLVELARWRSEAGDPVGATVDAKTAAALLTGLDVVLPPADAEVLARLGAGPTGPTGATSGRGAPARLARDGKWWVASHDGARARLPGTKGLRYLAVLLEHPGAERHALDLVDRVEGVDPAGRIDRRRLGDAGAALDARARDQYRRRIEELRGEAADTLAAGRLEAAEAAQEEIDQLVRQLAHAFGLGGRDRRAASAAERARLNVTRALRSATARLAEALPGPGAALDRGLRTGLYCAYEPAGGGDVRWIVQS